jgi:ParB family chromosome partitioning protein
MLSQSNVRHGKAGVPIGEMAEDIARRKRLGPIIVRPELDENGMCTISTVGRRFRALE